MKILLTPKIIKQALTSRFLFLSVGSLYFLSKAANKSHIQKDFMMNGFNRH